MDPTSLDHAFAALVGVLLPVVAVLEGRHGFAGEALSTREKAALYGVNGGVLIVLAAAVLGLGAHAGRSADALGLVWPEAGTALALPIALSAATLLLYAFDSGWQLAGVENRERARERWRTRTPFLPEDGRELALFVPLALVAGTTEELVFRGFLVPYLASWLPATDIGTALAVVLAALPFGLAHLYQGRAAVAKVAAGGMLLGALFVLSGSLLLPMLVHVLVDLAAGLLSVALLRRGGRP